DEVGAVDLVDQIGGAACEIAEPPGHREALALLRGTGECGRREEARLVPGALGEPLDHAIALAVERDDLDGARLRVRRVDAEARFRGRRHPGAFALHRDHTDAGATPGLAIRASFAPSLYGTSAGSTIATERIFWCSGSMPGGVVPFSASAL